ncbi:MAG TPA: OB-fold nucleic acid binding domain-containing protein, partial [Mucilaginibacter sp.]
IYLTGHPLDNYKLELQRYCNTTVSDLKLMQKARSGEGGDDIKTAFAELRKRAELSVGGLVSNAQHKMTKTGKPFGTFVLEDYNDSYEFALFGEEYADRKKYLVDGYFLYIKGTIEEKFRQKDNWDLRIGSISLLSEMRDKMMKSMTVCLELNSLNDSLMSSLEQIVESNNQKYPVKNCTLRFLVKDMEEALLIELPSKTFKVNPSDDLMAEIQSLTNAEPMIK